MSIKLDVYIEAINGEILTENVDYKNIELDDGYCSDLLSDVMGNALDNQVWITIMRHLNVIAVASLTGVPAVVFTKNIKPDVAVIEKANNEEICLITCKLSSFEASGILYQLLKK